MRRLPFTRLGLAAAGLMAGAAAGAAQPEANRPRAYLSTAAADGTEAGRERGVALRPNTELPYFAYVVNPSPDAAKTVTVTLARDEAGKLPVARGTLAGLPGSKAVRVPLALVASPAPPPAAPAKPGDPPPPAADPMATVPDKLYLHTETAGEDGVLPAKVQVLPVGISPPATYLDLVGQPTFKPAGGDYALTVTLKDRMTEADGQRRPFRGPPAKVRLDVRPALMPGLDPTAPKAGTYESVVPPGAEGVVLTARLRFAGKPSGVFAVAVDGYDRAFVFDVGPEGNDATPLREGFARLDLPRYAVPGKPLPVRVEVFQEPVGAKPVLTFQRSETGQPQPLTADRTTLRDETRTLRAGPAGELFFGATVKDWVIPVDTTGVYGPRAFRLATDPPVSAKPAETVVTFDDTPPAVRLVSVPESRHVATQLQVFADVADDESGLTEVLFFLGDPPGADGKLPPTSEGVKGVRFVAPKPAKGQKGAEPPPAGRHTATFLLPETKGKVKVGVRAVNGAGLATLTDSVTVRVVEPPPPPKPRTVGDIKVRVIQGSSPERPQPGLPVELRSADGKAVVKAATTDDKGEAVFKDVPPGGYILYTVKRADLGAQAYAAVSVVADKQTDATLEVKR